MSQTIRTMRMRLMTLALPLALVLAACESDMSDLGVGEPQAMTDDITLATVDTQGLDLGAGSGLRSVLAETSGQAGSFEFDTLAIPAGPWDGYAQATEGAFLQCLVAWGPREARLAFSVGWQGRLFMQFTAPGWNAQTIADDPSATIAVDDTASTTVDLGGSGDILWANLGVGPSFANIITDGKELTITSGADVLVFPLQDARIAMPALYECLDRETGEDAGDGAFAIYGLDLDAAARADLANSVTDVLRSRGFAEFVPAPAEATAEAYGGRTLLSGDAWQGNARLLVSVFGARTGMKKALAELVDDAARICRGEVAARLMRLDQPEDAPSGSDRFARSSLLCADAGGEFTMETLAIFADNEVVAVHAIVRNPEDRTRVDQTFDAMRDSFVAGL